MRWTRFFDPDAPVIRILEKYGTPMTSSPPIIVWFRRDLRLSDHPALSAACQEERPIIPVFILDEQTETLGAAAKLRLGMGLEKLSETLDAQGSRLIYRRGEALQELLALAEETGAKSVYWSRLYDPKSVERDTKVKRELKRKGFEARSFGGHLLFEPWTVETKTGGYYKVYSPMWKSVRTRVVDAPLPAPSCLIPPETWPPSDALKDWSLDVGMNRGARVVSARIEAGEKAAIDRLDRFVDESLARYKQQRDLPGQDGTSNLSDHLSLGELSPHRCWHAVAREWQEGNAGAETFLKELVWREFAYHLMHHTPRILTDNWREEWSEFPWITDETHPHVVAWKQGRTGVRFVDAAMREMYVTGRMHNRGRMIVASYLTKHLMCHWKVGLKWFEDCLTDWDPASNAMGWQWAAGSGPDAAPYFRIFNPDTQLDKFDKNRTYAHRWIAEIQRNPDRSALAYFDAVPRHWCLDPKASYPEPIVSLREGRARALAAYENRTSQG